MANSYETDRQTDRLTDWQTDICDSRVAFATEKDVAYYLWEQYCLPLVMTAFLCKLVMWCDCMRQLIIRLLGVVLISDGE